MTFNAVHRNGGERDNSIVTLCDNVTSGPACSHPCSIPPSPLASCLHIVVNNTRERQRQVWVAYSVLTRTILILKFSTSFLTFQNWDHDWDGID